MTNYIIVVSQEEFDKGITIYGQKIIDGKIQGADVVVSKPLTL